MHSSKMISIIPILALALAASGCCACCDITSTPTPTPGGGDGLPSGYTYGSYYQNDPGPSAGDIQKSSTTLGRAADALDMADEAAFVACLSAEARGRYGAIDLTGDGAKKLAQGIRDARIVRQYSDEILYEATIDGEQFELSTTKEGGEWKIDSF
jgi:hypothetical protein